MSICCLFVFLLFTGFRGFYFLEHQEHGFYLLDSVHAAQSVDEGEDAGVVSLGYEYFKAVFFADVTVDVFDDYVVEFVSEFGQFYVDVFALVVTGDHDGGGYVFGLCCS